MGMTVTEKILAAHAHQPTVRPGDVVVVDVDAACVDDVQFHIFRNRLREMGDVIRDPDRMLLVADHYTPPVGLAEAAVVGALGQFGRERGIRTFLREGIKHPLLIEEGIARPGDLIVATDSHTNTAGAVGAFAAALGPTDMAALAVTGRTWLRVPPTIRLEIDGTLPPYVLAVDVALAVLADFGLGFADYRAVEWTGDTVRDLGLNGRMTLCNLTTEFGAKNGIVEPRTGTGTAGGPDAPAGPHSDTDAVFESVHHYDAAAFGPVVAVPPSPANVHPVSTVAGTRIDQAYLGSCTHGSIEDLRMAATVLRGRRVHPDVELLVTPPTRRVYEAALRDGTMEALAASGATICAPGCGSCPGIHAGTLAKGQVRISTQSRNFVGRSGHPDSLVYLGSPLVVAAAAVAGVITHPADVLAGQS